MSKKEQTKAHSAEHRHCSATTNQWRRAWSSRLRRRSPHPDVASARSDELIQKTELAVAVAEETAQAEREKALDPIVSPDAAKAKRSIWAAEFSRDRLRAFWSRLWERLNEIERVANTARWKADYDAVEAKRDS